MPGPCSLPIPAYVNITDACSPRDDRFNTRPFTLGDITDAINRATSDEINDFVDAMQHKIGISRMNIDEINTAISVGTPTQLNQLAFVGGLSSIYLASNETLILDAMSEEQAAEYTCKFVETVEPTLRLVPEITFDSAVELTTATVTATECGWLLAIIIGADILGGLMSGGAEKVEIYECNTGARQIDVAVTKAIAVTGAVSDGQWKQNVSDSLAALLTCCPPCTEINLAQVNIQGYGQQDYTELLAGADLAHTKRVSRFYFELTDFGDEPYGLLANPTISMWGKLRFMYEDGTLSPVHLLNGGLQECKMYRDDVVGINYWLYPTVKLTMHTFARPRWIRGLANGLG